MKRFLISRLSSLGDVVCSLPAAGALKRTWPDCRVTWVVDPRFAGVVECCAAVDQVLAARPRLSPTSWNPNRNNNAQARRDEHAHAAEKREEYDVAFDLQGLLKSAIFVARAKAREKLGYHWQREGSWLFSSRVLPDPSSFHVVDQYVDVARAAGAEADRAEFRLAPKPEDLEAVRGKLATQVSGELPGRLVVINPGAGWASKRWPPERFAKLIEGAREFGCTCVLIGGKAPPDQQSAAEVLDRCSARPLNLCGQTSVRELIALISIAKAHVGGDTGSTHIAAALGVPAIGLYSITRPERSCPYGQIERCNYDARGLWWIEPEAVGATLREAMGNG